MTTTRESRHEMRILRRRPGENMATMHSLDVTARHAEVDTALAIGDELLTVQDAARFLNVSVSWVYEHTRDDAEDRLPFMKLGKYLRFDRADLRAYVDAKRAASRHRPRRR
jgi:excisionase family DNA binding protein